MAYKPHPPAGPLLIGYDPDAVLSVDHLARLIERVVNSVPQPPQCSPVGQSAYAPAMLAKVLLLGYATGTFSSRRIAQNCYEHLAYAYLTRGERPCFRTLCSARTQYKEYLERVWLTLVATAANAGLKGVGRIAVDSSRFRANASGELVVSREDYEAVRLRLEEMLRLAKDADAREDGEGMAAPTSTGVDISRVTIRQVIRSVGKEAPGGEITPRTEGRLRQCLSAVAEAERENRSHVSLTDPDARMMPIGSQKRISMGHALEVASDSGLLVAGGTTNGASDAGRLVPLVEEAQKNDPSEVVSVVADSGFFEAGDVLSLQDSGLEVVVPDSTAARGMRCGNEAPKEKEVRFYPLEGRNALRCPMGNVLDRTDKPDRSGRARYRARHACTDCPLADRCLSSPETKRRVVWVRSHSERIGTYLGKFADATVRTSYFARGPAVETVFALIRGVLGFQRWSVRGSQKVAAEAEFVKCAYLLRKTRTAQLRNSMATA